ncbi:hypothetical protein H9P43_007742 [Blastocladiella emersonii ATCC 22665]|nr:hypothetical protein H9P43_007742 [Blastocladiella emersonii ATCC 22665]
MAKTLTLAVIFVAVALLALHAEAATFAPPSDWCYVGNCAQPPAAAVKSYLDAEQAALGNGPAKCGNGVCEIHLGETCASCAADCGQCAMAAPIRECKVKGAMALTFDDGSSQFTSELVDTLNAVKVRGTFFVLGVEVMRTQVQGAALKKAFDSGHVIGLHTYTHRSLGDSGHVQYNNRPVPKGAMPFADLRAELVLNDVAVHSVIGKHARFVRPPFLDFNAKSMNFMETAGYVPVNINADSNDWKLNATERATPENVLAQFRAAFEIARPAGSWIHLQHDTLGYSVRAVKLIIEYLRTQPGVKLVGLDECLGQDAYRGEKDLPFVNRALAARLSGQPGAANATATKKPDILSTPTEGGAKAVAATTTPDATAQQQQVSAAAGTGTGSAPHMAHPPHALSLLLVLALLVTTVTAAFPPASEWCYRGNCAQPPAGLVARDVAAENTYFGPGPARCGDGICDVRNGETCASCPADCGGCTQGSPLRRCRARNVFALTIDDGPTSFTADTVRSLNALGVKATFFVNGVKVMRDPQYAAAMKLAYDSGHTIGTHTYSHRSFGPSGDVAEPARAVPRGPAPFAHMRTELVMNDIAIQSVIGVRPRFFRPPYLEFRAEAMVLLDTAGYDVVNVNVDSDDWRLENSANATPAKVIEQFMASFARSRGDGSHISLQHDTYAYSMRAIPDLVRDLQRQGLRFVGMDECLGAPAYRAGGDNPFLAKRLEGKIAGNQPQPTTSTTASSTSAATLTTTSAATAATGTATAAPTGTATESATSGAAGGASPTGTPSINGGGSKPSGVNNNTPTSGAGGHHGGVVPLALVAGVAAALVALLG